VEVADKSITLVSILKNLMKLVNMTALIWKTIWLKA